MLSFLKVKQNAAMDLQKDVLGKPFYLKFENQIIRYFLLKRRLWTNNFDLP